MFISEGVGDKSYESAVPYVWSGGHPLRPARPCTEHGDIACKKHASSSYPESRVGLIGYRIWAGIVTVVPVGAAISGMVMLILTFGMWVLYAPIVAFFASIALYGIGWGSTACYRLAKK